MRLIKIAALAATLFGVFSTQTVFAQSAKRTEPTVGVPWTGDKGISESVSDIMVRENQKPFIWYGKAMAHGPLENEFELPPKKDFGNPYQASQYPLPDPKQNDLARAIREKMSPQPIGTKINMIQLSESGYIPPDTTADVGPTKILAVANGRVKTFTKAGAAGTLNSTLDNFFTSVRNGTAVVDPVVRYDRTDGHWVVTAFNTTTPNRILIAYSQTNDPDGAWWFYQFTHDVPGGGPNNDTGGFADYTKTGVGKTGILIGANIFNAAGTALLGTSGYVINKAPLNTGGALTVTAFRRIADNSPALNGPWAPTGVDDPDGAATEMYFLGVSILNYTQLCMYRVTNISTTPVLSALMAITTPLATNDPILVPAQGSTTSVDVNDDRLFAARVCKNKLTGARTIWTAHVIQVNSSGVASGSGGRDGSRWYELNNITTTPGVLQSGTLFDSAASNPNFYFFPTIAMSTQGHMALGATSAGAARRLETWTAGRYNTTGGTIDSPSQIQSSSTNYTLTDSFGRNRWGDYSHTSIDPNDGMTIWTFQEYCNATNSWMTQACSLTAPPPASVTSLAPNTIAQGATTNIVVTGTSASSSGFFDPEASYPNHIAGAFSGTGLTVNSVTFTDPTHITLNVTASGGATLGLRNLTVTNPDGQQATGTNVLTVTSSSNPLPTTTSISPAAKNVGDGTFTMTVNGTNFISSSVVRFNGSDRTTTFVSATQVTCSIPASDMTVAGTFNITVFNPLPGGGTSNAQTFTVNNKVPTTTSISPATKNVGDGTFTMTVNGTNFVNGSTVRNNGNNRTTTFVSATQLTCSIPASDMTTAGTFNITVFNATPGGGTSNAQTFTVNNLVPTTTSISPATKNVGDGTFTMTVNGTNFVNGSTVRNNGNNRTTTFVSSTQLTCSIPASDMTTAGTFSITVFTATPGGGTSNAQTFTVNNKVPTTTLISPNSKNVGDATFTMSVSGTNFVNGSVVRLNGVNRTTTFLSSTGLTCSIPASDMAVAGTFNITVFNPTPGGGTSNAQTFTVNNKVPTTTSISPTSKIKNSASFTMTVNGTNFVNGSIVRFNGSNRTTVFVSATQLTATINASDLTAVGTFPITVFTATPGGGTSNSQNFSVVNPTISGTVTLQGWTASPTLKNVTIEIRNVGSGSNLISQVVSLNGASNYSFTPSLGAGTYDIYAKADHWLKRRVGSVVITNTTTNVNFSLINGDCDNDNENTIVDNGIIGASFGKSLGDAGYDARADLDGDDEITLIDVALLSSNFGISGDD